MNYDSPHTFHIPVMGLAYTIDTPLKVSKYGISSVLSIGEDRLVELMRKYYCNQYNLSYTPISHHENDYRAKRITGYLDLINIIVTRQIEEIKKSPFEPGSEITKYFEILPEQSHLSVLYHKRIHCGLLCEKNNIQQQLRDAIRPRSIDVNVMTKTDRNNFDKNNNLIEDGSDAVAALRGYAKSQLNNSSIVFSAGMNPRLFSYIEKLQEFLPDSKGEFEKKVIIKVSDYRSALIQGKYLAKKGIWVSEFRVESGLNCGGHAFATEGYLMGPILNEFKKNRHELATTLFDLYNTAMSEKGISIHVNELPIKLTVQGGIGTAEEDLFLRNHYGMDSTGWGTPFLLVPEATTVDDETLQLLSKADTKDIELSYNSPLGVRFFYLKGTSAEKEKENRIAQNKPGSPCTEKHLAFNTEFTEQPLCTASHKYQKLKIAQIKTLELDAKEMKQQLESVTTKECLCVGLSNAAPQKYQIPFLNNLKAVTVCPGPNIVNFDKVVPLQTMIDHIYGRVNLISKSNRPHLFLKELQLYVDYLKEMLSKESSAILDAKKTKYYSLFFDNLKNGVNYYKDIFSVKLSKDNTFTEFLTNAELKIQDLYSTFITIQKPAL
ncbi:MAG: hypothetical protein IPP71_17390 [Bacteroidetes bacterium]|nr:hypothetical protein [Bacteroidota bacterium]